MASIFDKKAFNAEVFGRYVDTVSDLRRNELLKAGVFRVRTYRSLIQITVSLPTDGVIPFFCAETGETGFPVPPEHCRRLFDRKQFSVL